jgi:uncharacterized membrane protein
MTDSTPSPAKSSTGLEQNVAAALSYLLGFITGIVFLIVEKDNTFVRFHAMQSTITFGGLFALYIVLTISIVGWVLLLPLTLLELVLWIVLMVKAFGGEMFKLPWVGDIAEKQVQK